MAQGKSKANKGTVGTKRCAKDAPDAPVKEKAPAKKARTTRARPKRGKQEDSAEADSDSGQEESDEGAVPITVEWDKDEFNLTWKLVTALTDNEDVKNALFPPTGGNASTKRGGGKKKTEHHWTLAKELFRDHPDYSVAFAPALKPGAKKLQNIWKAKIKNRLANMVTLVLKSRKEMGATGEGIQHGSEITLEQFPPAFVNKWAAIQEKCPYYFEMLGHIGERPNWTPVGLGNSVDTIDSGVIFGMEDLDMQAEVECDGTSSEKDEEAGNSGVEGSGEDKTEGGGEDDDRLSEKLDRSAHGECKAMSAPPEAVAPKTASKKKTPARSGSSNPTSTTPGQAKGKSKALKGAFDFEELAKAEETTHQCALDVKKEKIWYNTQKVRVKGDIKLQREKNEYELHRLEMEHRQQLMLEQMRLKALSASGRASMQGPHHSSTAGSFSSVFSMPSGSQVAAGSQASSMETFGPFSSGMGEFDHLNGTFGVGLGDAQRQDGLGGSSMSYTLNGNQQ